MPTIAPTHSAKPKATRVYHNISRCAERNNIDAAVSRQGAGGRALSVHCCSLKAQGK